MGRIRFYQTEDWAFALELTKALRGAGIPVQVEVYQDGFTWSAPGRFDFLLDEDAASNPETIRLIETTITRIVDDASLPDYVWTPEQEEFVVSMPPVEDDR